MAKNWVFLVAGLGGVVLIAAIVLIMRYGPDDYSEQGSLAWGLGVGVADINRQAPIKLDELTTLASAELVDLHVTYKNELRQKLTAEEIETFQKDQGSALLQGVCENPDMQTSLNGGAFFTYEYVDETGTLVGDFTISKKDC